ncbi:hypothetical protein [Gemmata algarum]|uniref:hypothetical protein n=1 Tax=Gemmata algarum TaxID=2975278 RepID=UPI002A756267|nr:hypothetical protein [Gemmata algarum]
MSAETPIPADAPAPVPIPPELLAWARQTFDASEFLAGVREIEATGGEPLESFVAAVETAARGS